MAKKKDKHITINRNKYNDLRKMDHGSLEDYVNEIYEQGMAAGMKEGMKLAPQFNATLAMESISMIKGIGEAKAQQIRLAMIAAGAVINENNLKEAVELRKRLSAQYKLIKLIQENPGLKIIAYVDSEIVADDGCGRWLGSVGDAWVKEYTMKTMREDYPEIVEKEDPENLEVYLQEYEDMSEKEVQQYIKGIQWEKAIFVYINLPE